MRVQVEIVVLHLAFAVLKPLVPFETACFLRSNRAVQILDQHKATYGAFNVLEDVEIREGVKKFS